MAYSEEYRYQAEGGYFRRPAKAWCVDVFRLAGVRKIIDVRLALRCAPRDIICRARSGSLKSHLRWENEMPSDVQVPFFKKYSSQFCFARCAWLER